MQFLKYNYKMLKYGAFLPLNGNSTFLKKFLFYFYRVLSASLSLWTIGINVFYFVFVDRSFAQLLGLLNGAVYVGVFIRIVTFYYNDQKILKIILTANEKFKTISNTLLDEISISPSIHKTNVACFIFVMTAWTAGTLFAALPLIFKTSYSVMPLWYPYNSTVSPYFEMSTIFQLLSQATMCYNYDTIDMFYICLMVVMAKQFTVLAYEMENVCFTALSLYGIPTQKITAFKNYIPHSGIITNEDRFYDIYQFMQSDEYLKIVRLTLIKMIDYHKDILNYCEFTGSLLSPLLLVVYLNILGHSVLMLYTLSLATNVADSLMVAGYFTAAIFECFLIAFTSDLIVEESSKLQFSLYSSHWYLCPKTARTTFKICHFRVQQNVGMSIGKFTTFDLKAYGWLMKTSFSYFTVLQNQQK